MKIFFPIGSFFPCQIGGQASALYWHVKALGTRKINCNVFTSLYGIDKGVVQEDESVKTEYGTVYYASKTISFKTLKEIYKNLKNTDIIHLHGVFNITSTITLLMWKLFASKKSIICTVHGELNPNALEFSSTKKIPTLWLYRQWYKKIIFHTTSDQENKDVVEYFKNPKTINIPNLMQSEEKINNAQKKQFLFMGRIHEIKALHKFIEALSLSKLFRNSDFILDITGSYEDRHQDYFQSLQQQVKDYDMEHKVKFSGHISGKEKEVKYAESYFLILPSETENFGNVVIEALNQGTPVLASLGTPWNILEEYKCGFHTNNSPNNLAVFIDKIISMDSEVYQQYSDNTTQLVNDKFNINTQINRWISIYQNINHENTK